MQIQPEAFTVAGELSVAGASFAMWAPPADDVMCLRVELFGSTYRLPAKVVRVDRMPRMVQVHVTFDELPVDTQLTLARWVDSRVAQLAAA